MQISEGKRDKLADCAEKVLRYAGKMMQCIESLDSEGEMGERSYRSMGMRDEDEYPDDRWMGERRDRRGRYSRY